MPLDVATHDGPFHADDVTAVALIRAFVDPAATVVRTRDPARIATADLVVDVGGDFEPARGRFDHHQAGYTGPRSAAGMVLDWLAETGRVSPGLAARMRAGMMDYLDAVDNGRVAPRGDVPCLPRLVEALNAPASAAEEFDRAFEGAARMVGAVLEGMRADHARIEVAREIVEAAMADAAARGSGVVTLEAYLPWKGPYFAAGGESHPTAYVLHPGTDGSWRVHAIPPRQGEFGQKRPLPEAWAGLSDGELEAATGIPGSVFCHKNRFIAVFRDRAAAEEALRRHGLDRPWGPPA